MIAGNLTEEQMRNEIQTKLKKNMFVEAGAGAGKTTLIVSRIVNLLLDGVEPGEIVVITFTNPAAEELRGRIIDKVREEAKKNPSLLDQLHRLSDMNISTIHSFCNVLLHEQGLSAGIPLETELLQDEEECREKTKYFDEYLQTLTEADWDELEKNAGQTKSRGLIRGNIEELYNQIADLPEDTDIMIPEMKDAVELGKAMDALNELIQGDGKNKPSLAEVILSGLNSSVNPNKTEAGFTGAASYEEAQKNYCIGGKKPYDHLFLDVCEKGHSTEKENECYKTLLGKKEYKIFSKSNFKAIIDKENLLPKANADITAHINSVLTDELREIIPIIDSSDLKDENGNAIPYRDVALAAMDKSNQGAMMANYAVKARRYYRQHAPNNRFSNDRLLELTRDLILGSDRSVLEYFSGKYTHFFVDEFQDTDRIQESFIYRLASKPDDENELRDGALFVVGDPKQSIYRFRGAQPAVYFRTKEKMAKLSNAMVYELSNNFRSNKEVINWVNDKFVASDGITPIVAEEGIVCGYQSMTPVKDIASGDNVVHGIYHIGRPDAEHSIGTVNRKTDTGNIKSCEGIVYNENCQEDDIKAVVNLIKDLTKKDEKNEGYFKISDYKKDENGEFKTIARDIALSDFLLISHNKEKMYDYVKELKKYDIPVILDGKGKLQEDRGLVVFVRLYQYLVNPRDQFYRIGAEEALRETLHIKSEDELHAVSEDILDCLYEDAKYMSAYGMAEYLERQVSALFDKGTAISQVDALSTQTHIRQMVEYVCRNVTGTGIELAEAMQKFIDTGIEHELSLSESPDAVRFMNLHKTKGLEGNIVIMLDRRGKKNMGTFSHSEGNRFYPGIKEWTSLAAFPDIRKKAGDQERAEFHRLEYVAVTRAGQAVIFMDVLKHGGLFAKKKLTRPIKKSELVDAALRNGPTIHQGLDDRTFSYEIKDSVNIRDMIEKTLQKVPHENKPHHSKTLRNYEPSADAYPNIKSEETPVTVGIVRRDSPSGREKTGSKKKTYMNRAIKNGKRIEDEKSTVLPRPTGNIFGDMLHRSMELMISRRFTGSDISIAESCLQAVNENHASIERINPEDGITEEQIRAFLIACAEAYNHYMDGMWADIKNVYPEVKFSYRDEQNGETVWMNGTADLIIEKKDGTYILIDYKSDNDFLISDDEMEEVLSEKYTPQLEVYRSVIRTMLGVPGDKIITRIISFSQKDSSGNLLPGSEVRVRVTEL